MTEQLHNLIDRNADQPVINERIAGLLEGMKISGTDHEKRIRYLERVIGWALGAVGMISTGMMLWSRLK